MKTSGFTLVEFILAVVFVGVVLAPLLLFAVRIQELNHAVGQQARREAGRSFVDQAVAAGINPIGSRAFDPVVNGSVPRISLPDMVEAPALPEPGVPQIVPLRSIIGSDVAEPRIAGAGFQIGAGAPPSSRSVPTAPLAPVIMPTPVVTPADGAVISASTLRPGAPGEPYSLTVEVASIAGSWVRAVFDQPHVTVGGPGAAQQTVSSIELLQRVNGSAWTEFAATADATHQPVVLADGRTRWLVTTTEKRLQIYEPSPMIRFAYTLDLGWPVLAYGSSEHVNGATLAFDYGNVLDVQTGAFPLRVTFPATVRRAFGSGWPNESIGFQWTFGPAAGPFDGRVDAFFQPSALSLWADSVVVSAVPVVPTGATASAATWTFTRVKVPLGAPLLSTTADNAGFYAPGHVQFSAPPRPNGEVIGRLSFDNGRLLSTGPSLSVDVIP